VNSDKKLATQNSAVHKSTAQNPEGQSVEDSASGRKGQRIRRWSNPYIERLGTLPELILGSEERELSPQDLEILRKRCAEAPALMVELGSGSGSHLIAQSQKYPERLHVGIELRFKRVVRTAEKAAEAGCDNMLVLRTSSDYVAELFAPNSIEVLYINFPDPWYKKRWRKHRVLSDESLGRLHGLLKKGGMISFKTDHREYFEEVVSAAHALGLYAVEHLSLDLHASELVASNVVTEFENLFLSQRLPIHLLQLRKAPA
jgi:tRNA (guanine-N7-)-methyltransferase